MVSLDHTRGVIQREIRDSMEELHLGENPPIAWGRTKTTYVRRGPTDDMRNLHLCMALWRRWSCSAGPSARKTGPVVMEMCGERHEVELGAVTTGLAERMVIRHVLDTVLGPTIPAMMHWSSSCNAYVAQRIRGNVPSDPAGTLAATGRRAAEVS